MLTTIVLVKFVAEMGLMAFLGRAALAVIAGAQREANPVYQLLSVLVRPFVAAASFITPRFVLSRHHSLVAFCVLCVVWLSATVLKISLCIQVGLNVCR